MTETKTTKQEIKTTDSESESEQNHILKTEGLTKRFGDFTAVDDVSFSIAPNETKGLIGPNGAGKTTFQNMLTGKLPVTEGKVIFKGQDITGHPPHRRVQDGIVRKYQVTSVYEEETVLENMRLALRGRGSTPLELAFTRNDDDIRDRIDELLATAGLEDVADKVAGTLSYGNKQWLEMMMAVGADPELLMLDEPTSGMSVSETNATAELIEDIRQREDVAILVIEHDMDFIKKVASNITVLNQGEVIARGTIEEVKDNEAVQRVYLGRED